MSLQEPNYFTMGIKKSYRIWTAPRTGHTLLAKMLEMTGRAGRPGEHLTLHGVANLQEKYNIKTFEGIRNKIWEAGSDDNRIFACKVDGSKYYNEQVINELGQLKGLGSGDYQSEFWYDLFPNCKDIFLTRRNKIRQAVSWWKAIQDETWHLKNNEKRKYGSDFYKDKYVFDAINHLFKEACLREAYIQECFSNLQISAMTVVYEDFILDSKNTLHKVFEYLGINTDGLIIPDFPFQKTADEVSEEWVERFRKELQQDWDKMAW